MEKERNSQRVWGFLFFFFLYFVLRVIVFGYWSTIAAFQLANWAIVHYLGAQSGLGYASASASASCSFSGCACVARVALCSVLCVPQNENQNENQGSTNINLASACLRKLSLASVRSCASLCLCLWSWAWAWAWAWHSWLCYVGVANYCELLKCNSHTLHWLAWPRGTGAV